MPSYDVVGSNSAGVTTDDYSRRSPMVMVRYNLLIFALGVSCLHEKYMTSHVFNMGIWFGYY